MMRMGDAEAYGYESQEAVGRVAQVSRWLEELGAISLPFPRRLVDVPSDPIP